jgi:XXXCH domain-containing protein
MGRRDHKLERKIARDDLPTFLRTLASLLEEAVPEDDSLRALQGAMSGFGKMKISIKEETANDLVLKLKVKREEFDKGPDETAPSGKLGKRPKYSVLKKRLEKSFSGLSRNLDRGSLPSEEVMNAFLGDSGRLVTYPGKGDPFYKDYSKLCRTLKEAYEGQDIALLRSTYRALDRLKNDCHDRFK